MVYGPSPLSSARCLFLIASSWLSKLAFHLQHGAGLGVQRDVFGAPQIFVIALSL